jgi:uncharacterized ubiquitin-like protein YukD
MYKQIAYLGKTCIFGKLTKKIMLKLLKKKWIKILNKMQILVGIY